MICIILIYYLLYSLSYKLRRTGFTKHITVVTQGSHEIQSNLKKNEIEENAILISSQLNFTFSN